MRRYSGGNIGGRNKPGSGVYSLPQQLSEKLDGNWPSSGSTSYSTPKSTGSVIPWTRNPSWLTLPYITSSNEKFAGLVAINSPNDYMAISATGNYTVNWGDGTIENFSSGTTAYHTYDYTNSALANTNAPVTFTASSSTVNRSSHGYSNGDIVSFNNIITTTGIQDGRAYYVINKTNDTFQISNTRDGSVLSFVGDGSAALLPHKQAIVTVVPQAGQQLTTLNLQASHPSLGNRAWSSNWLDIAVSGPNFNSTGMTLAAQVPYYTAALFPLLEQVTIKHLGAQTSMAFFFNFCTNLQSYEIQNANYVTDYNNMFYGCRSLYRAAAFTINPGSNVDYMFQNSGICQMEITDFSGAISAEGLFSYIPATELPDIDLSSCTNFDYGFSGTMIYKLPKVKFGVPWTGNSLFEHASSLTEIRSGDFDFSLCTEGEYMFYTDSPLWLVEIDDFGSMVDMGYMFTDSRVQKVKIKNVASLESTSYMFYAAKCIEEFEMTSETCAYLNNVDSMFAGYGNDDNNVRKVSFLEGTPLPSLTSTTNMFNTAGRLKTVSLFDTSNVTNMDAMFYGCTVLESVPKYDTSKVTSMGYMFGNCRRLISVPQFDTSNVTDMNNMFWQCYSLNEVPLFDTSNVTNMGAMFYACSNLKIVPQFNTSKVTNMGWMFRECDNLETVPKFNMSNVVYSNGMFWSNFSLKYVPSLDMPKVTDISNMFNYCTSLKSVPEMNLASGLITASGLFSNCFNLEEVGDFDNSKNWFTVGGMFDSCLGLNRIPSMNASGGGQIMTQTYFGFNLSNVGAIGIKDTTSFLNCKLDVGAIKYMLGNLANGVSNKTITLTNNPGTSALSLPFIFTSTAGSNVISVSDTTSIYNGGTLSGNAFVISANATYNLYEYYSTFQKTGHGMANGDSIILVGGPYTDYYQYWYQTITTAIVRDATANTFKLAPSVSANPYTFYYGPSPLQYVRKAVVSSFVPNTSVTISFNMPSSLTNNVGYITDRAVANAVAKGWTITL